MKRLVRWTFFVDRFVEVIRNRYADFEGRAGRTEYWSFTLFNAFILFLIAGLDAALGFEGPAILAILYLAATIVPSVAVLVRRLHDTNKSRWWLLLALVPIAGWVLLLVLALLPPQLSANRYGSSTQGARVS